MSRISVPMGAYPCAEWRRHASFDDLSALQAASAGRDVFRRYRDRISAFEGLLDRHLLDEEEIVIPTILEHRRSL